MSQIRHKTLKSSATIAILALMPMVLSAEAATLNSGLRATQGKTITYSTPLSALKSQSDVVVIDWRTPSHTLTFDGSETNWTSNLNLTLSADPIGRVNAKAPIFVSFNGQPPIKINTKGRGFDAHLSLEATRLQARHNTIRIYYEKPHSTECLLPQDGGWALNLSASELKIKARQKAMNYRIQDIEARLSNAITAPELIGLIAIGEQASEYQTLLAQGVGMRMDKTPRFTTAKGYGDIDFIVGRRDNLKAYVRNRQIFTDTGANIYVDSGKPMRVILTGDTDNEVLNAARSFAQFALPHGRMTKADPGHMALQPRLKRATFLVDKGQTQLSTLGNTDFSANWRPDDRVIKFNVKDPHASQGEVLLRLDTPKTVISSENLLSLSLNGQALGQTPLNKSRKSVAFPIPSGLLQGQDNELRISAALQTEGLKNCASINYADSGISLGAKSSLYLSKTAQTPITDLSRFTATGAPFSDKSGANTVIVLPKRAAPYNDALGLLARLAKTNGEAWTQATILRGSQNLSSVADNKNILFITPSTDLPRSLMQSAPKSLKAALQGQPLNGDNLLAQKADQYASLDTDNTLRMAARTSSSNSRIGKGGIAALFESPYDKTRLVGVITNTPRYSFRTSLNTFQQPHFWNNAEGSVARWNNASIIMAALASPLPHFVPTKEAPVELTKFEVFKSHLARLDFQNFDVPEFDIKTLSLPKLNMPDIDWEELSSKLVFWQQEETPRVYVADTPPVEENNDANHNAKEGSDPEIELRPSPPMTLNEANDLQENEPHDPLFSSATNESFLDKALNAPNMIEQKRPELPTLDIQKSANLDKTLSDQTTVRRSVLDHTGYPQEDGVSHVTDVSIAQKKTAMDRFATPVTVNETVASVQQAIQPARVFVEGKINTLSEPTQEAFEWAKTKISSTGLILLLALLTLLGSFGLSDPKRQKQNQPYR